jgi:hypothetical protein
MANLRSLDMGFRSDHLLTMRTAPARRMEHSDRMNYYDRVLAGVLALPGVENAVFVSDLPFQQTGDSRAFQIEGRPAPEKGTNDDLKTLPVKLLSGEMFDQLDGRHRLRP